jgi:dTDP-glucose 4,6-dehydratase
VRTLVQESRQVLVFDKLSYAGHRQSLSDLGSQNNLHWCIADLCDQEAVRAAVKEFRPNAVFHLAAESHVDRSITSPLRFAQSNLLGTVHLLEAVREYWSELDAAIADDFRMIHVSTDEVFGALGASGAFSESSPYRPSSPYAASKASADHFVRAYRHTYHLPVCITNCSNNFGPYQHPEKLIPKVITRALTGEAIPVYGNGEHVRDWLHVNDHCHALLHILNHAPVGEDYMIGANYTVQNIDLVGWICDILDDLAPAADRHSRRRQIQMVADRPGHDFRYAVDPSKLMQELNWSPQKEFHAALRETILWYLENRWWWQGILNATLI